jgi:hypothetical protein
VEGSCGHSNEPSGSIKCWKILEWLIEWRLLKKGPTPWSKLFVRHSEEYSVYYSTFNVI